MENEGDRIVHVTQQEIFDVVMETFGGDALGDLMSNKLREIVAFGIAGMLKLKSNIRENKCNYIGYANWDRGMVRYG